MPIKIKFKQNNTAVILFTVLAFFGIFLLTTTAHTAVQRLAVFTEPDFPANAPRESSWYLETLKKAGISATPISLKDLENPETAASYDALLLPTGGLIPIDGEETIGRFLDRGKMVIVDGNVLMSDWRPPAEVLKTAADLKKDFLSGENITAYRDYLFEQGISAVPSNLLRYNAGLGRWSTPISSFYYLEMTAREYSPEFHLEPWPNYNFRVTVQVV
jgi:hypothetical protein